MERYAYSVAEVAQLLGISQNTVRNMINARILPHIRAGRRVLVPAKSLEDFTSAKPQEPVKQKAGNSTRRTE